MNSKKTSAMIISALMLGLVFINPALASTVTSLDSISDLVGVTDSTVSFPLFGIGASAQTADVAGALDVAVYFAGYAKTESTVTIPGAAPTVTNGVTLDTADTKLYLTQNINKAKTALTAIDLPTLLKSGYVETTAGTKYQYGQYISVGGKTIKYAQPEVGSDPVYLIKLGTDASSGYTLQAWVSFTKQFNASKAIGKPITLFGEEFTISSDTDSSKLVLFGLAGKETIDAGETKTISVGGTDHDVTVIGVLTDGSTAVISVDGIQKEVVEGNTYDFAGTSVYVSDVFYYKVPSESGSVVVSLGADRYVLKQGQSIKKGTSGNEKTVKGTYVKTMSPEALSDLKVYLEAYSATPAVDYIEAGGVWTAPVFSGIKVSYNGPASSTTENVVIQPGSTDYYTITFTDKYGKEATVSWLYDSDVSSSGGETLADSIGKTIHVLENETAAANEYLFVSAGTFPHMFKVESMEVTGVTTQTVTFRDVFSGTEYDATNNTDATTGTMVVDGQTYTVTFDSANKKVSIRDSDDTTSTLFPALETTYGAKIAFVTPTSITNMTNVTLPTGGEINITCSGADQSATPTGSQVKYNMTASGGACTVGLNYTGCLSKPAILLIEEETKDPEKKDAAIFYVKDETTTTPNRLELQTPTYTHATGNIYSSVSTSSTYVKHTATEWGTKIVYDTTAAGEVTATYPDTQMYHSAAVGTDPTWSTTEAGGEVTTETVLPITDDVVELDNEITSTDKTSKDLVLVGGPCVNELVDELADAGKFPYGCADWPGENFGRIQLISDAFADGYTALVIAGTRAVDTDLAARIIQQEFPGATETELGGSFVEVTGTVSSPAYSA